MVKFKALSLFSLAFNSIQKFQFNMQVNNKIASLGALDRHGGAAHIGSSSIYPIAVFMNCRHWTISIPQHGNTYGLSALYFTNSIYENILHFPAELSVAFYVVIRKFNTSILNRAGRGIIHSNSISFSNTTKSSYLNNSKTLYVNFKSSIHRILKHMIWYIKSFETLQIMKGRIFFKFDVC